MRNRVYLIYVETLQNAVKRMTFELANALSGLGFETCLFNPETAPDGFHADAAAGKVAGLVAFNTYGFNTPDFVAAMERAGIPLFFYSTDHPYLGLHVHKDLIASFSRLRISLTVDEWAVTAGILHDRPEVFSVLRQATEYADPTPWEKRDIPHLVVGNNPLASIPVDASRPHSGDSAICDPAIFRNVWHTAVGELGAERLNRMVEIYEAKPFHQLSDIVDDAIRAETVSEPASLVDIQRYTHFLDMYLRAVVRLRVMRELLQTPVLICGQGWDFLRAQPSRAHFLGSVESGKVLSLTGRTQRMYNLIPTYYACSERVLEAAMLGTPVISTPTRFFQDEFGDSLTLCAAHEDFIEAIHRVESQDVIVERTARARAITVARHTWAERASHIAAFFRSFYEAASP